jgi:phage baseplate assembly protein W
MAEIQRISRSFKDISLSFQPHPVTGDLPVLKNERAINASIKNIVQTIPGEKFFNSLFGSEVRSQLFEQYDVTTTLELEEQITSSINRYEPRVNTLSVEISDRPDRNELGVTVSYTIVGQEFPSQKYSFILEATR